MKISRTHISNGHVSILSLILVALIFFITSVRDGHNWQGDFSQYIMHAQNLLNGHAYTELNVIPADTINTGGTPPGFPLSIVPILYLFGVNFIAFKLLIVLFWGSALYLYWQIVRLYLPRHWALGSVAFLAFTPWVLKFSNTILGDIPYLAVSLLAVLAVGHFFQSRITLQNTLFAGLALLLACLFRNVGVILIGVFLAYAVLFKRSHLIPALLVTLFSYTIVFLLYSAFGCGSSYLNLFTFDPSELLIAIQKSFLHIKRAFLKYLALYPSGQEQSLLYITINHTVLTVYFSLSILGAVRSLRQRGVTYHDLYIPAYLTVLLIYPYRTPTRYLLPIIPFLSIYAFEGFRTILAGLRNRSTSFQECTRRHWKIYRLRYVLPALVYAPLFLVYWGHYTFQPTTTGANILLDADVRGLFEKVQNSRQEISGVFFWRPRILRFFTDVRTVSIFNMNEFQWDLPWLFHFASKNQVSHIILDPHNPNCSHFVRQNQNHFQTVYKNEKFELLQIVHVPKTQPSESFATTEMTGELR